MQAPILHLEVFGDWLHKHQSACLPEQKELNILYYKYSVSLPEFIALYWGALIKMFWVLVT